MKRIARLFPVVAALAAVTVLAQDTNTAPSMAPAPAAATPAASAPAAPAPAASVTTEPVAPPAVEPAAKPKPAKRKLITKRVVLDTPAAATVKADDVNVRSQPNFVGEVIGHVQKGEAVTVIADVTLVHPEKGEPGKWCQIEMPTNILVWVNAEYIDAANHTVKAHRVNLRGGPGENFSIVGRLDRGTAVEQVQAKEGWLQINPPTNAYAFVAAEFIDMQPAAPAVAAAPTPTPAATPTPEPTPTTVNVASPTPVMPATNETAAAATTPAPDAQAAAPATTPAPVAPAPTPQSEVDQELAALHKTTGAEPATAATAAPSATNATPAATDELQTNGEPRVVTREGLVHRSYNIQTPTDFELRDIQSGDLIDYLRPESGTKFKIYIGTRVNVTGPEFIDKRWPRTPVLQVTNIQLVP